MTRAVLSIGSNLGDRLAHLQSVLDDLGAAVTACSGVHVSTPWGGVEQPDFLNAVLLVDAPELDCWGWLRRGQELERAALRQRGQRWGPRSLDVDVVDCAGQRSDDPELTLPHPRAHQRAFVLAPWSEVDPAAILPGRGPVAGLWAQLPASERAGVRRCEELSLLRERR